MATLNHVMFIGRLGKEPVLEVNNEGKPYTRFSLAVDQGKGKPTMWLNIVCWEKVAETVERYAHKGTQVFVLGKLQLHTYTDKNKIERLSVEINATNVQLLERRQKEGDLPDDVLPEA